jgi:hypothetical protein
MSECNKRTGLAKKNTGLTKKEWTGVATVFVAGTAVGGPLGGAAATVGVVAGTYAAKQLGWNSDED